MSKFMGWFRKRAARTEFDCNIVAVERGQLPNISVKEIQMQEVNGIIIRNFLSLDKCQSICKGLERSLIKDGLALDESRIYPASFAQLDANSRTFEKDLGKHFQDSADYIESFTSIYGFDLLGELRSFFEETNPGLRLKTLSGLGGGCYQPSNFRIQCPLKNSFHLHCDNQFSIFFKEYYRHLRTKVAVQDQVSYFLMLQQPDSGGRLILYDITWDKAQVCNTWDNTITTLDGKTCDLNAGNDIRNTSLQVGTGDLVVFAGGQIWHAVEEVFGNTNRITFGGFLGLENSSDAKDLYWWS